MEGEACASFGESLDGLRWPDGGKRIKQKKECMKNENGECVKTVQLVKLMRPDFASRETGETRLGSGLRRPATAVVVAPQQSLQGIFKCPQHPANNYLLALIYRVGFTVTTP